MLPAISHDKALHVIYGVASGVVGAHAAQLLGILPWQGALVLAVIVGVAKELADKIMESGVPDVVDAFATAIGGAAVALAVLAS